MSAFQTRGVGEIGAVRIGNDNGARVICRRVEEMLAFMNISHVRIHSATPMEDAHIESFNSILEKEVMRMLEFDSFEVARPTVERFIDYYNTDRLSSTIWHMTLRQLHILAFFKSKAVI